MDEKLLQHIGAIYSNAVKYSPRGGTVHFDLVYEQQQTVFAFKIEASAFLDQANSTDSFHKSPLMSANIGTGLGLMTVQKICRPTWWHNLPLKSEVGVILAFTVILRTSS